MAPSPRPVRGKGPRPKHVPQRMCVACREHDAKRGLIRIVRTPEGAVALDPSGRQNGRGAYLCHQPACWERALRSGALARALNTTIDGDTVTTLSHFAASLPLAAEAPVISEGE
jgi:predicted RNA-binding protein YlxR (DUF448 family)